MSSMDQSARRNPTDPMMATAGKARLCSYYSYWSHTVANTQQFAMSPYGVEILMLQHFAADCRLAITALS